ncbi:MAG: hypothetical protein CUN53_02930 [Phototrophicales bacterium]|nr:MAG: hypothetical protein CUN53_02930 [Phototrophicales bacterium]
MLLGMGVAVKRGVLLTMGASVAVGGIGSPPPIASHAPVASSIHIHIQRFRIDFHTFNKQAQFVQDNSKHPPMQKRAAHFAGICRRSSCPR